MARFLAPGISDTAGQASVMTDHNDGSSSKTGLRNFKDGFVFREIWIIDKLPSIAELWGPKTTQTGRPVTDDLTMASENFGL